MLNFVGKINLLVISFLLFSSSLYPDSYNFNTPNNHGVLGLINMPSARFYDEGSIGVTIYDGTPDRKLTITSSPYNWLEASFFYTSIQNREYGNGFNQSYKDKGFNFKLKLKEEGLLPALAIGINDAAGTGLYSSEYIVGSYGLGNLDMHLGLGWGSLNNNQSFKNPLAYINDSFENRPDNLACYYCNDKGGQFSPSTYFSDKTVSPFFGISYALNSKILLKIENDSTKIDNKIEYQIPSKKFTAGIEYLPNKNFVIGLSKERGNYFSVKFTYKKDASGSNRGYSYKKIQDKSKNGNKYDDLINSLEANGIGVNKIIESADSIGIEVTQFSHPNLNIIEDIIYSARRDSGIKKQVKTEYKVANLTAYSEFEPNDLKNSKLIYQRESGKSFNTDTKINFRPFIAGREGFFKYAILAENNTEFIIKDNFFFTSNLKYSIKDNFDDLVIPPVDVYPAQVRSDVKEYLRNFENKIIIGRAQFDYHLTPIKNNHLMFTAGILEEMFSGYGVEYLYFNSQKNYAVGFEIFDVRKRDYELRFGNLDYQNTTAHLNFYYRNYNLIPFDAKVSYGEFLAGDTGTTFELSRSFLNGAEFGVFATFTDVTSEQFGEGSFDKGIFFNIPIYKNFVNYTWRPLTKDPGAKLNRKHTLNDLLVKFRPYNN